MVQNRAGSIPELRVYIQTVTQIMFDTVEEFIDPYKSYIREQIISSRELDNSFLLLLGSGMRIEGKILKMAAAVELFNLSLLMHESVFYKPKMANKQHISDSERATIFMMAGDLLIYKALQMLAEIVSYDSLKKIIACSGTVGKGELKYLHQLDNQILTKTTYIQILKETGYLNAASLYIGMMETSAKFPLQEPIIIDLAAESFSIYSKLVKEVAAFKRKDYSEIKNGNASLPMLIAIEKKKLPLSKLATLPMDEMLTLIEQTKAVEAAEKIANEYKDKALQAFSDILPTQAVRTAEKIIDLLAEYQVQ